MNQFSQDYGDRFIGIAVHADNDPMKVAAYLDPFLAQSGITGFPGAYFNRKITGDPYNREAVEQLLSTPVGYAVRITEAIYDDTQNHMVTLKYAPKLAFSTSSANISAAVVVTEDGVSGTTSQWNQTNNYSGYTEADVAETFGKEAWPYFKFFCESGGTIKDMKYDHVAMGIFHSYSGGGEGGTLPKEWTANEEQEFSISFEMPLQRSANRAGVQDWRNTHLIVLIIDNTTGEILTADKIGAAQYVTSGITETYIPINPEITVKEDNIYISTEGNAQARIYSIDGQCLYSSDFTDSITIEGISRPGAAIVYVTQGNHTYAKKIIL